MAGRGNPSFLKNQKARKRQEKAAAKRAARQARRDAKSNPDAGDGTALDDNYDEELDPEAEGAESPDGEGTEEAPVARADVTAEEKPTP